jgi:hypothetical protein
MIAMVCAGIGGVLLGMFISYLLARRRARKKAATLHRQKPAAPDSTPLPLQPAAGSHYTAVPSGQFTRSSPNSTWYSTLLGRRNEQYHIDPFIAPDEEGYREPPQRSDCTVANPGEPTPPSRHSDPHSQPPLSQREPSQVYVVHHDGGTPPVTVYTAGGTEVVELPPRYPEGRNQTSRRQPAANRMKVGGPNRRR